MSSVGSDASEPSVQAWSNDSRRAGAGLQRTVAESIRQELDEAGGAAGVFGQLARLAFPIGIGPQGVLLAEGYEAVRISGSGELPPPGDGPVGDIDEDRLGALGRATLRTVTALDQGRRPAHGPESCARGEPGAPGLGDLAVRRRAAAARARCLGRRLRPRAPPSSGRAPGCASSAPGWRPSWPGWRSPSSLRSPAPRPRRRRRRGTLEWPLDGPALGVLGGVLAAMVLALVLARWLAARPDARLKRPDEPGAAVAIALTISLGSLLLWLLNPYAGLLAVPAAHLWMLAVLVRPPPSRRPPRDGGGWPASGTARDGLLPLLAVARPASRRLVPADARDRAQRRHRDVAGGLPASRGGVRHDRDHLAPAWGRRSRRRASGARPLHGPGAHAGSRSLGGTGSAPRR